MADLSLDDFIKKNNVKVRIKNLVQSPGVRKPQEAQRPMGNILAQNQIKHNFDARQKLGPKPIIDARSKIINIKKSSGGDARNKIVEKQVQKGTFDARSILQRQGKKKVLAVSKGRGEFNTQAAGVGAPLTRTLSNPNAKIRGQVQLTSTGLSVTRPQTNSQMSMMRPQTNSQMSMMRPQTNSQISMYGSSLQVTKHNKLPPGMAPLSNSIPIIQIRNDHYKQPVHSSHFQSALPCMSVPPPAHYGQQTYRQPAAYAPYEDDPYSDPTYVRHKAYSDLDDRHNNLQSIAMQDIPKFHVSNIKTIENAGMRPVFFSGDYFQTRAPPGAATLSLSSRQPVSSSKQTVAIKVSPAGVKRRQTPTDVSGPLRLGKGGGPGIDLGPSPNKRSKSVAAEDIEVVDLEGDGEFISPLQGFRVVVTNLFNGVTQDDIIELFGAVGPLKKAKLLKSGSAEVVYMTKTDAMNAVQKYHSRELDGQPMYVKMTTPIAAEVKSAKGDPDPDITGEALRLYQKPVGGGTFPEAPIEAPTVHRALFKAGPPGPNKSVRFTVKI